MIQDIVFGGEGVGRAATPDALAAERDVLNRQG